ncbi:ubiquinol-cytochrome-c reductase complex assembly factor 1 isoform X1 [Olea europaea subsp. europaea]|uniref:Ubiquinol-cytochrome-c reductase complex assembly factor 1 isoform X1 n=1 Tax=Olea europaea subsp. europaea TaxID=158383 RepID=A0A8S0SWW3_OLEEU|nr:ubiquinol-cytochrome-c reductase complex assembly factor 1 isoform X1 [Olea europaea subsp. europaea]
MFPRWSRAISKIYTDSNFQRNTGIIRKCSHTFAYQNYSNVAAAAEPNLPDSAAKTCTSRPEVNFNKMFWSKPCSLALPPGSPQRIEDPKYEGFKRVILKMMLFYSKQSQSIRWANAIYSRVLYQVDRPSIYDVFSLEKTFKTTFSLLVIHMWLCLRRLKEEGNEGVELGQYLYEIYNHDLELRVSKAGVNLLLTKWMKDLEKIFYGNVVAYDASMIPEGKQDQLQSVIWRNVFSDDGSSKPSDATLPLVQAMSRYVHRETRCLLLTDKEAIFTGNFMFTQLENTGADSMKR